MTRYVKHTFRIVSGFALVILGIVGLIMPIMPGWVFLVPGLILLADYFPPIRRLLDWAKAKLESEPHLRKYRKPPRQSNSGLEPPA